MRSPAKLDFDDAVTKPYFALPKVEAWAFDVARRLYGLEVKPAPHNPSYHPDAKAWEVWDSAGQFIAHLTTDWHPRKGKRAGAWMTSYRSAYADERGREVRRMAVDTPAVRCLAILWAHAGTAAPMRHCA